MKGGFMVAVARKQVEYSQKLVSNRKRVKKAPVYSYTGIIIILTVFTLIYLGQYALILNAEFNLNKLAEKIRIKQRENRRLKFELERLKTAQSIERIARGKLGMVEARNIKFIEVEEEISPFVNNKIGLNKFVERLKKVFNFKS